MKTYNTPLAQWRRDFYSSPTGRPSLVALKSAIDNQEIEGGCVAGKYHITTLADGQPIDIIHPVKPKKAPEPAIITSPIALRIIEKIGA